MLGPRWVAIALGCALVVASCGATAPATAPAAEKRTIHMTAVEYKGSTETAKEPFPTGQLPEGNGYKRTDTKDGKWETSTYRWEPGTVVVYQGDDVELRIFGVNGASHPSKIEGYDKTFAVKRGELTTVSFKADKSGLFRILCDAHSPSMTGLLVVLPRG